MAIRCKEQIGHQAHQWNPHKGIYNLKKQVSLKFIHHLILISAISKERLIQLQGWVMGHCTTQLRSSCEFKNSLDVSRLSRAMHQLEMEVFLLKI